MSTIMTFSRKTMKKKIKELADTCEVKIPKNNLAPCNYMNRKLLMMNLEVTFCNADVTVFQTPQKIIESKGS